ncbi:PAS domain-containing protein, partial [Streptomyces sp. Tu 4128]
MSYKRCNGEVVGQGAAERGSRTLRAGGALKAIASGPEQDERPRRILEQALVFAGASLAALYTPSDDAELLCLSASAGVPRTLYGVRDSYPASGGSPVADAHRGGEAVWVGPEEFAESAESRHVPSSGFSLATLPVRGDGGGCLLALTERPDGFDAEDRACLELVAEALTCPAPAEAEEDGELLPDSFSLAMDTGRVEAGDDILRLFGLAPGEFDGKVETLLGLTVPEDLPSLMSVTESDHMTIGDRELEFRVLQPAGPPKWLRLSGRLLPGGEGRPTRLVGTVADASTLRPDVT